MILSSIHFLEVAPQQWLQSKLHACLQGVTSIHLTSKPLEYESKMAKLTPRRRRNRPDKTSGQGQARFRRGSKAALFLDLAKPNTDGFSRRVDISEFTGIYSRLQFGNGGDWCRSDGRLATVYNVERIKEKGKIVAVQLFGFNKVPIQKPIPQKIHKEITSMRCAVLGTSDVECDHKDGRRDDPRLSDVSRVTIDDFQPLSKAANSSKRQHCKECRETNVRFDAKRLGFQVSQILGNGQYRGTCVGCYWYDVKRFHSEAGSVR